MDSTSAVEHQNQCINQTSSLESQQNAFIETFKDDTAYSLQKTSGKHKAPLTGVKPYCCDFCENAIEVGSIFVCLSIR